MYYFSEMDILHRSHSDMWNDTFAEIAINVLEIMGANWGSWGLGIEIWVKFNI